MGATMDTYMEGGGGYSQQDDSDSDIYTRDSVEIYIGQRVVSDYSTHPYIDVIGMRMESE